jgi:hypothetical protein
MGKENKKISDQTARCFTLTLEPVAGSVTMFYAFINGIKVIQADGRKKRIWNGKIPDSQVKVKIRVIGIDEAEFKLGLDLPGTTDDQSLTFNLDGGYYEMEITL